jgi:hypothetical protein
MVFYHIPKCTGSFIDNVLNDRDDFVSYNFLERSKISYYRDFKISIRESFHQHASKFYIPSNSLSSLFEFTFVRNPYTRFISAFFYCKSKKFDNIMTSLEECIRNRDLCCIKTYFHIFKTQYQHIKMEKKSLNFIGRCENLHSDLKSILQKFNIDCRYSDLKINKNPISYGDYRQYYTSEILDFVNSWFDEDFIFFGYKKVTKIEDLIKV